MGEVNERELKKHGSKLPQLSYKPPRAPRPPEASLTQQLAAPVKKEQLGLYPTRDLIANPD
ncbi:MAG: hypothetical protein HRT88_03700 [Lentisphaeraceae bacterium]|nr:hypothetical protein [Lentisphaeraceae bacterium]